MYSKPRFWRWYRTIPILAMVIVCVVCFGARSVPLGIAPNLFYPVKYKDAIVESSNRHDVDPRLTCAIIKCESNWNEKAESAAGAKGLMQVMESTSSLLSLQGVVNGEVYDNTNLMDPVTNIEYGAAYLGSLKSYLGDDDQAVIAGYNAGPGAVESWLAGGGDLASSISYPETAAYLLRVSDAYTHYKELYDTNLDEV